MDQKLRILQVTPRKRRVSRNVKDDLEDYIDDVTPRKRRVSRNSICLEADAKSIMSRLARGV